MKVPIDVRRIVPEAQSIVEHAAHTYIKHVGSAFLGMIAHGSAVKGDFIPGCSDVDVHLYVAEHIVLPHGALPFDIGAAIHADLARIDLGCFAYLQCQLIIRGRSQTFVGPVPGAYQLVAGTRLLQEATDEELYNEAVTYMNELHPDPLFVTDGTLGYGRLQHVVRLLCTKVWPTLYHVLVLSGHNGIRVWNLTKDEAIRAAAPIPTVHHAAQKFYNAVRTYYPKKTLVEDALTVMKHGVNVMAEAKRWWNDQHSKSDD